VDRQAEGLGAAGDGGADAAHADDAEALAPDAAAEHPGRRPAGPFAVGEDLAPSISRRGTARISAMVMSAVSSVSTFGVLVTVMPFFAAASTSMWSTPLPKLAISFRVNVRRGPSSDHAVAWVFNRKGLPVEIVAEFETWRRVRDSDGEEGWILQNMLSGKRTAMMAPWKQGQSISLYDSPSLQGGVVAKLAAGVVGDVSSCTGDWCEITAGGYDGYIEQTQLWGVYPGEAVD
jgi:SH3-like domain-containing protein